MVFHFKNQVPNSTPVLSECLKRSNSCPSVRTACAHADTCMHTSTCTCVACAAHVCMACLYICDVCVRWKEVRRKNQRTLPGKTNKETFYGIFKPLSPSPQVTTLAMTGARGRRAKLSSLHSAGAPAEVATSPGPQQLAGRVSRGLPREAARNRQRRLFPLTCSPRHVLGFPLSLNSADVLGCVLQGHGETARRSRSDRESENHCIRCRPIHW